MKDMTPKDVESLQMKELEKRRLVRLFNAGVERIWCCGIAVYHTQTNMIYTGDTSNVLTESLSSGASLFYMQVS